MFEKFLASFQLLPADQKPGEPFLDARLRSIAGYPEIAAMFAGCTFDGGLYRIHDAQTGSSAVERIIESFPQFAARSRPFAYDWLGRQFALDWQRVEGIEPLILLLEPGTGEALEIPCSFHAFHEELADLREPALAQSFFEAWQRSNPASTPLAAAECVGYKIPLFLGGKDVVENLEVIDIDVYWRLSGQLRAGTRLLPPGTSIAHIERG